MKYSGNGKTKSIILTSEQKAKSICELYYEIQINKKLGYVLDKSMSGEHMALKIVDKMNEKLKSIYRKNKLVTLELCRMLCNAPVQQYCDYVCLAW